MNDAGIGGVLAKSSLCCSKLLSDSLETKETDGPNERRQRRARLRKGAQDVEEGGLLGRHGGTVAGWARRVKASAMARDSLQAGNEVRGSVNINWQVVATIAAPIVAFVVGAAWQRWLENRPVLISFYGHVAAFTFTPPGGQASNIHTHAVVLRNASRKTATNVRFHHHGTVPDFTIWQPLPHHVETLPGGSQDIVIPTLVPGKEIIVSYLYFPPVTFQQINAGIDCDQGGARAIPVLLRRVYPRWANNLARLLALIGLITVVYLGLRAVVAFIGS